VQPPEGGLATYDLGFDVDQSRDMFGFGATSSGTSERVLAEQVLTYLRHIDANMNELAANQREVAAAVKGCQTDAAAPGDRSVRRRATHHTPTVSTDNHDQHRILRLTPGLTGNTTSTGLPDASQESLEEGLPVHALASTMRGDIQFLGEWIDPEKRFYGGAVIEILEDSWRPVDPPDTIHSRAVFERNEISDVVWELMETQQDGSVHVHTAVAMHNNTIKVENSDTGEIFELRRRVKKSVLKNYYPLSSSRTVKQRLWSVDTSPRKRMKLLLRHPAFDRIVGFIILVNSIFVGVAIQKEADDGSIPEWMEVLEHIFLAFYTLELGLRFGAAGFKALKDEWIIFDLVLVVIGTSYAWIIDPILQATGNADGAQVIQVVVIFRLARLMRLVRSLRRIPLFNLAWRMAVGLIKCSNTVLSTVALLILLLYTFACIGMEVLTKGTFVQTIEGRKVVEEYFSNIPLTMLTLVQFVTMDSISSIYTPLILDNQWLCLYFLPIILVISIMLMNLVTAVIVESALNLADSDAAEKKREQTKRIRKLRPKLKAFFKEIDFRNNGAIMRSEMEHLDVTRVPEELKPLFENNKMEHVVEMFDFLDTEGTGRMSQDEFVEGLENMLVQDHHGVPDEMMLLLKLARSSRKTSDRLTAKVNQIKNQLNHLQDGMAKDGVMLTPRGTANAGGGQTSARRPTLQRPVPPLTLEVPQQLDGTLPSESQ
jgi:voltage-gated sodium channel